MAQDEIILQILQDLGRIYHHRAVVMLPPLPRSEGDKMMRQLTDSERIARDVAKSRSDVPYLIDDRERFIFDLAFTAALDHTADKIAALTAERDGLAAENERLRAALQQIADGNPAPPGGKWLSDSKMAQIARSILSNVEAAS